MVVGTQFTTHTPVTPTTYFGQKVYTFSDGGDNPNQHILVEQNPSGTWAPVDHIASDLSATDLRAHYGAWTDVAITKPGSLFHAPTVIRPADGIIQPDEVVSFKDANMNKTIVDGDCNDAVQATDYGIKAPNELGNADLVTTFSVTDQWQTAPDNAINGALVL